MTRRTRALYEDDSLVVPTMIIVEEDRADYEPTGLLDASGHPLARRRAPAGFIDFGWMRERELLPGRD